MSYLTVASKPQRGANRSAPSIQVRRYGRNDFERFHEESARGSHLCVGSESIGNIAVDCKYRWKKSQWGVMGYHENPAGIVYMDITFHQPAGCSLARANVFITLSEDSSSYALDKRRARASRSKVRTGFAEGYGVQFTEHWGPKHLTGTRTTISETTANKMVPTVGVMGFEFGGIGRENSTTHDSTGQWSFKGNVGQPIEGNGFRTLHWELSENCLDPGQVYKQEYHTAFAFEHSSRPVYMRVEIDGKLRSWGRNFKHDFVKFSSNLTKQDHSTLTLMTFNNISNKYLDEVAKGLNMAMQMENCEDTPLEVPGSTKATFASKDALESLEDEEIWLRPSEEQELAALEARILETDGLDLLRDKKRYELLKAKSNQQIATLNGATTGKSTDQLFNMLQAQLDDTSHSPDSHNRNRQQGSGSSSPSVATTQTLVNTDPSYAPTAETTSKEVLATKELLAVPAIAMLNVLAFISAMFNWFSVSSSDRRPMYAPRAKTELGTQDEGPPTHLKLSDVPLTDLGKADSSVR